jgi:hypothetical protein
VVDTVVVLVGAIVSKTNANNSYFSTSDIQRLERELDECVN